MLRLVDEQPGIAVTKVFVRLLVLVAVAGGLGISSTAAAEGGFYLGAIGGVAAEDVRYEKNVFTREGFLEGIGAGDSAPGDGAFGTVGVLAGYRWRLGDALFVSVEGDVLYSTGTLDERLPGTGQNQGQVWPEDWSFEKAHDYGLTARVGTSAGASDLKLYAVAGVRAIGRQLGIEQTGCPDTVAPCPPGPLAVARFRYDQDVAAWTVGAGLEKPVGDWALQLEVRYTDADQERWTRLFNAGEVVIPLALRQSETNLQLRLLRYF